jgi:hypothetical protein
MPSFAWFGGVVGLFLVCLVGCFWLYKRRCRKRAACVRELFEMFEEIPTLKPPSVAGFDLTQNAQRSLK